MSPVRYSVADVRRFAALAVCVGTVLVTGCRSVEDYRDQADRVGAEIIAAAQNEAVGRTEPMGVTSAANTLRRRLLVDQDLQRSGPESLGVHDLPDTERWQGDRYLGEAPDGDAVMMVSAGALRLTLAEALQVGARNSRDYQDTKEGVFRAALALDLERETFRNTLAGLLSGSLEHDADADTTGVRGSGEGSVSRTLRNGAELSTRLAVDLAKLLTQDRASSLGLLADATVTIPLMRGSGRFIVTEDLTQAERDVLYAIYEFERYKRTFAVGVARDYLTVLQQFQRVDNERENYRSLIAARRRMRRLADSGRRPEFEYDQAIQDELRARSRWIQARQSASSRMDSFKVSLGLPADSNVELDMAEVERLRDMLADFAAEDDDVAGDEGALPADAPIDLAEPTRAGGGPLEMVPEAAIAIALESRLDLRAARGRIEDARRKVLFAADGFRPEVTLLGKASAGSRRSVSSADSDNARLDPTQGTYSGLLTIDLPIERTAERNRFRTELLDLQRSVRNFQELEDNIKLGIRERLRGLLEARANLQIQRQAVALAERRVNSTDLLLQAGRAQIRDVLEAQDDLLTARNSLDSALVNYRVGALELQRDLGVLNVSVDGIWQEYNPEEN